MSQLISFSRYQAKCVIKFLFRQLMTSENLRFIFDQPPKLWLTGRKRGKTEIQTFEYLDNENIFHSF